MAMPKYLVDVPILTSAIIEVEAPNEDVAIELAECMRYIVPESKVINRGCPWVGVNTFVRDKGELDDKQISNIVVGKWPEYAESQEMERLEKLKKDTA
jgi:hypothetical protein